MSNFLYGNPLSIIFMLYLLLFHNHHHLIQVPLIHNICWKELSLLVYVWVAFLIVQIIKVSLRTEISCKKIFFPSLSSLCIANQ
jgi:hypothetical protein